MALCSRWLPAHTRLSTLASFNGTNGAGTRGSVIADTSGNLYGTTAVGGANHAARCSRWPGRHAHAYHPGHVQWHERDYSLCRSDRRRQRQPVRHDRCRRGERHTALCSRWPPARIHVSTLVTFNNTNGAVPLGGLIADASGNLYGTTVSGGANGDGTVFEVAAGTHALSTLVTFNGTNGANPYAGLLADASGNLYGTTDGGGASGDGTVFEVTAGTLGDQYSGHVQRYERGHSRSRPDRRRQR